MMNFMILATKKEATGASYNQRSVEYTADSDTDTSAEIEKDSLEDFSSSSTFPVESVRYVYFFFKSFHGQYGKTLMQLVS